MLHRIKKRKNKDKKATASGYITVQRLTSTVDGKCQKYNRMGSLKLVQMEKKPTLDSINEACKGYFKYDLDCDVLAGERRPSYTDSSQIKNFKFIHVQFVEGHNSVASRESQSKKEFRLAPRVTKSSVVPSLSFRQMLKVIIWGRLLSQERMS